MRPALLVGSGIALVAHGPRIGAFREVHRQGECLDRDGPLPARIPVEFVMVVVGIESALNGVLDDVILGSRDEDVAVADFHDHFALFVADVVLPLRAVGLGDALDRVVVLPVLPRWTRVNRLLSPGDRLSTGHAGVEVPEDTVLRKGPKVRVDRLNGLYRPVCLHIVDDVETRDDPAFVGPRGTWPGDSEHKKKGHGRRKGWNPSHLPGL